MSRFVGLAPVFIAALAISPLVKPSSALADSSASGDTIVVRVGSLRNNKGSVRCSLYNDADGFPTEQKHIIARVKGAPSDKSATCTFKAPARGKKYAVVIHHDENDDGAFQRSTLGLPQEGYGFSNNVRPKLTAPSFEDCQFDFSGGKKQINIAMLYWR